MSSVNAPGGESRIRKSMLVRGRVQGMGFRPFIHRLASSKGLSGWVCNSKEGVLIEVEGTAESINEFVISIKEQTPAAAIVKNIDEHYMSPVGYSDFKIKSSDNMASGSTGIVPDIATCHDCVSELFNKSNRRYMYPFITCTSCGPRFSIIESMPYDRENTSMKDFYMCTECRSEYEDSSDRRFHSQTNSCSQCGPEVLLTDGESDTFYTGVPALKHSMVHLRSGAILAVKGLGGFHLIADPLIPGAVQRLRKLKNRPDKPFALMYPDMDCIKRDCEVNETEEKLLNSSESPVVILKRRKDPLFLSRDLTDLLAPGNPFLGVMLPYTPLHYLLMYFAKTPIVATSGNIAGEPICMENEEAFERLGAIADLFLVHNRRISRQVDDSVLRIVDDEPFSLRSARGYAPMVFVSDYAICGSIALGGHLKNTVCVSTDDEIALSQYIGDLDNTESYISFENNLNDLIRLYDIDPGSVACDKHPSYLTTTYAEELQCVTFRMQHHYSHVLSCMAEHGLFSPLLGVCWDGTGYGDDNTIWGGEFLIVNQHGYERFAHLRTFPLPGAEKAIREPGRSCLGILYSIYGEQLPDNFKDLIGYIFTETELKSLLTILAKGLNSPSTSSAGRLFDAVASLSGLCRKSSFEGQAAMMLEFASDYLQTDELYEINIKETCNTDSAEIILDWEPLIKSVAEDLKCGTGMKLISSRFHNTLAKSIVEVAQKTGQKDVILTGGCFQNKYLLELTIRRLRENGFKPFWNKLVPCNDSGLSLGQLVGMNRNIDSGGF